MRYLIELYNMKHFIFLIFKVDNLKIHELKSIVKFVKILQTSSIKAINWNKQANNQKKKKKTIDMNKERDN